MELISNTIQDFTNFLASASPVPGGGSVGALVGALAAGLGAMASAISLQKTLPEERQVKMEKAKMRADELCNQLLKAVDGDVKAFLPLSEAYKLPKNDPNRDEVLEECLSGAAQAPLEVMKLCGETAELLKELSSDVNKLLVSDCACASALCLGAMRCGAINVRVNTALMKSRQVAAKFDRSADELLEKYSSVLEAIYKNAEEVIIPKESACITDKVPGATDTSAVFLRGAPVSAQIIAETTAMTNSLKVRGVMPTLALLRVGDRADDLSYERGIESKCAKAGIRVKKVVLAGNTDSEAYFSALDELNRDPEVHGILQFRPLPKQIDEELARNSVLSCKDVDGGSDASLAGVFTDTGTGFPPCTADSVMRILDYYGIDCTGKRVAVLGRSLVVGKPLAMMLMQRNATVTVCHSKTASLSETVKNAEIVVACTGKCEQITSKYIAPGAVVVDVGIHWNEEKNKLCGDVLFEDVSPIASAVTPVPGGVGAVTTSVLLLHTAQAAEQSTKK